MKKKTTRILICVLLFALMLQPVMVSAAFKFTGKYVLKATIPNNGNCTSMQSMCINGTTAYTFKIYISNDVNLKATLYKTTNFTSNPITTVVKTYTDIGHANGMTFYNNNIYVVTYGNNVNDSWRIAKIDPSDGKILKRYKSDIGRTISAITYYKNGKFIISDGSRTVDDILQKRYTVVTLDDGNSSINSGTVTYENSFYVAVQSYKNSGYDTFQDITYDKYTEEFNIPVWNKESSYKNIIICINLSVETINNKKVSVFDVTYVNGTSGSLFEIESMASGSNYNYFCTNGGSDGIYRLEYV